MTEIDVPADRLPPLRNSNICGSCDTILCQIDDWASRPAASRQESNNQVHDSFLLKDASIKTATCHLCAIFLSLFNSDEQRQIKKVDLRVENEWWSGTSIIYRKEVPQSPRKECM
jgi:hypothetical protein